MLREQKERKQEVKEERTELYVDRELSWLAFNLRVLMEAGDRTVPLYERLKFLAIYFNNLDEFFMIRIGSIIHNSSMFPNQIDDRTGWTFKMQLKQSLAGVAKQQETAEHLYSRLCAELSEANIDILDFSKISQVDELLAKKYFGELRPLLSAQVVDYNHPFPFLTNKDQYIIANLGTEKDKERKLGIIPLYKLPPFISFNVDGRCKVALTSELVRHFAPLLFKKYTVSRAVTVRVTRNADILFGGNGKVDTDFRSTVEKDLKKRKRQQPVRLQISGHPMAWTKSYLMKKLGLELNQVYISSLPCDFSFGFSMPDTLPSHDGYRYAEQKPVRISALKKGEIFRYLDEKDLLLSYPFQSMNPFVDMLYEAADDPEVLSIKITLYRLAGGSRVAAALAYAAEHGKDVLCLLELRARFDEQNNIDYSKMLEDGGCRIIYGLEQHKVHSKLCLITRSHGGSISYITQVGTGNYNESTAEQYTDLTLITADTQIGQDAAGVFDALSLGNIPDPAEKLWVAPRDYKMRLIFMINAQAELGQNGYIGMKLNSMNDLDVMNALVHASQAGTKVELLVRGICSLLPGIPGITDNISIKSVVGRYLEHSRIFVFGKGEAQRVFMGSGDLLRRNTERRVEVFIEVTEPDIKTQVLEVINSGLRDDAKGWLMNSDGTYSKADKGRFSSQAHLYDYFSKIELKLPEHKEGGFINWFKRLFRSK